MDLKKAYADKLEAQLDEWNAKIDVLKAKANIAEAQARIIMLKQVDEFSEKRSRLQSQLKELREAGEGAWDALKARIETAVKDLA